jgi:hypothetical protein
VACFVLYWPAVNMRKPYFAGLGALAIAVVAVVAGCAATGGDAGSDELFNDPSSRVSPWPDGAMPGSHETSGDLFDASTNGDESDSAASTSGDGATGTDADAACAAECGAPTCEDWGACSYADACAQTGTQTRKCVAHTCAAGKCVDVPATVEMQACMRTTEGASCGARTCPAFGACGGYASTCDTSGTQSRTCTDHICQAGMCTDKPADESQACTRSTNGVSCGSTTCGGYGGCQGSGCATTGTKYRTCTDYVCSGGSCVGQNYSNSTSCPRSIACSAGATQGCAATVPDSECPPVCGPPCAHSGQMTCAADCSGFGACQRTAGGYLCGL